MLSNIVFTVEICLIPKGKCLWTCSRSRLQQSEQVLWPGNWLRPKREWRLRMKAPGLRMIHNWIQMNWRQAVVCHMSVDHNLHRMPPKSYWQWNQTMQKKLMKSNLSAKLHMVFRPQLTVFYGTWGKTKQYFQKAEFKENFSRTPLQHVTAQNRT